MQPYKTKKTKNSKKIYQNDIEKEFRWKVPWKARGRDDSAPLSYKTPRNGGHLALLNQNIFPFRFWLAKEVHKSNVAAENG